MTTIENRHRRPGYSHVPNGRFVVPVLLPCDSVARNDAATILAGLAVDNPQTVSFSQFMYFLNPVRLAQFVHFRGRVGVSVV